MATLTPREYHWQYTELLEDRNFQIRGQTLLYVAVLFSVVLLIILIFLYTRWLCGFTTATSSASALAAPTLSRPGRGLERAVIDCLPVVVFDRNKNKEQKNLPKDKDGGVKDTEDCSICLGIFKDGEKIKILPSCRHFYHGECVDQWLRATPQPVCPLCRANLRSA